MSITKIKITTQTLKFLTTLVLGLTLTACSGENANPDNEVSTDETVSKIEVLDFHSTHRCFTCNAIEENTKYTLDTYFSKEQEDGIITFQTINIDEKENEAMAEKFEAAGTSLFLNVIKQGTETQIDLTDFAFMKGKDQDAFSKELKATIETELKTL